MVTIDAPARLLDTVGKHREIRDLTRNYEEGLYRCKRSGR